MLGLPQITYVRGIEIEENTVIAERVLEDSYEIIQAPLPALLTVVKEINEPRHASLRGALKAKKAEIPIWTPEDIDADETKIGKTGSPTDVIRTFNPKPRGEGRQLTGEPQEIAEALFAELRDRNIL